MKSIKEESNKMAELKTPYLAQSSSGNVFIVNEDNTCICIHGVNGGFMVGVISHSINPSKLENFTGTITLSN